MKRVIFFLGVVLLSAVGIRAQTNQDSSVLAASPAPAAATAPPTSSSDSFLYASLLPAGAAALPGSMAASQPAQGPTGGKPEVQGVFQKFDWQLSAGYTFFRFYETPNITEDLNGLYVSMAYYPGGHWYAGDGEVIGAFGSIGNQTAKFAFAGGGPRVRWQGPLGIELWGHGLVGFANALPQTPFGNQLAFGFDGGGGADLNIRLKRISYRFAAGVIGTRFFSTYQYSPYASAGIVYKF